MIQLFSGYVQALTTQGCYLTTVRKLEEQLFKKHYEKWNFKCRSNKNLIQSPAMYSILNRDSLVTVSNEPNTGIDTSHTVTQKVLLPCSFSVFIVSLSATQKFYSTSFVHAFISPPSVSFSPSITAAVFRFVPLPHQDPLLFSAMLFTHKCRFLSLPFFVYLCYPLSHLPFFLSSTVRLPLLPLVCTLSAAVLICLPARILPCFSSMLDFGH